MTPPASLQRPRPFRSARRYIIAVEGAKTEPWYFDGLLRYGHVQRPQRVTIEVLPTSEGRSQPGDVVARMADFERRESLRSFDQRWLVIDTDRHPPTAVQQLITDANEARWNVAISDPCFEYWLLLHFEDQPVVTDPKRPKRAASKVAKQVFGAVRDAADDPEWPFTSGSIARAIQRGIERDSGHVRPSEPGSHVHRLVEALVTAR